MFPIFHVNRTGTKYIPLADYDKLNYVGICCTVVYEKAGFSTCPVKIYSLCNYEGIKTVLIENGIREMIFRISFFVDGLQERIFACVRSTFSGI